MNLEFFIGDVEKILDPLYIGRVKVRVYGDHTLDTEILPTDDLPWATVLNDIHSHSTTGKGQTPLGLRIGSKVVGFYLDAAKQRPVVLGAIAGKDDVNTLAINYTEPGVGYIPDPENEEDPIPDVTLEHPSLTERKAARLNENDEVIQVATPIADKKDIEVFGGIVGTVPEIINEAWSQPEIPYMAEYPDNHIYESTTGHLFEFDDTIDISDPILPISKQRIHLRHTIGTGIEIHPTGVRVDTTVADAYDIIDGNHYAHIKSNESITINGALKILVNTNKETGNDYTIQVDDGGNVNVQVDDGQINLVTGGDGNDINLYSSGDINMRAKQDINMRALGNVNEDIEGNQTTQVTGNIDIDAARIDMN
jgi:hypothetical protein